MSQPQGPQTGCDATIRPIVESFLQRMTADQREQLREGSPDTPTEHLVMDLFLEIIRALSADFLKSTRRLKTEMMEEGVKASLGRTVTQALKEAINGGSCSCQCRSEKRLSDLISQEVHQSLLSSCNGRDAEAKPATPPGRLRKMLLLASKTCACVPRKVKDLFTSGLGKRPTPGARRAKPGFEPQNAQNHEGPIDVPEPERYERPKGTSGDSPQSSGGISAHELPGMVPHDPELEELNSPEKSDEPSPPESGRTDLGRGPSCHPDREDLEVEVVPCVAEKEKMSSYVKDNTLEFLIHTLVAKTLQKFKVDAASDGNVYIEHLFQRTRAELQGLDFNLNPKTLRQLNTNILRDLCVKWGGEFNVLIALKKKEPELGDWVASTLKDRLLAPPVNGSSFGRFLSPVGRAFTGSK